MQSHKQHNSNRYLFHVLADGAKPFRYRDRVRSLLGFPRFEGDGINMGFSPLLPPVGFRYVNHTFMTDSRPPMPAPAFPGNTPVSFRDEHYKCDNPVEKVKKKNSQASGQPPASVNAIESRINSPGGTGQVKTVPPPDQPVSQEPVKNETAHDRTPPGTDHKKLPAKETGKRENIDIPGFSQRSITFPSLTHEKPGIVKEKKTETRTVKHSAPRRWALTGCPRIEKNDKIDETGEYKNRPSPYKGSPGERRGEPCVHPAFSDSLLIGDPLSHQEEAGELHYEMYKATESPLQGKMEKSTDHKSIPVPFPEKLQKPGTIKERLAEPPLQGKLKKLTGKTGNPGIIKRKMTGPLLAGRLKKLLGHTSISIPGVENPMNGDDEAVYSIGSLIKSQEAGIVKEKGIESQLQGKMEKPVNHTHVSSPGNSLKQGIVKKRMAKTPLASPALKDEINSPSNRAAALRIQQLRQEVHRLEASNAKLSSPSARVNREEKQEKQIPVPGPPVQPVKVVRQWSRQHRVSRAFWERSYLGRFHMRTLR